MNDSAVSIAALSIMATMVAALVWLLKKQFTQNDNTIRDNSKILEKLSDVIDQLKDSMTQRDKADHEFQKHVVAVLSKISNKQDTISDRQVKMYKTISARTMNVGTMNVEKENVKAK